MGRGRTAKSISRLLNANYIIPMLEYYDVIALLQGHTHISESVHRMGIHYVTGGAVCGNWWKGAQFGDREGVTLVTVDNGSVTTELCADGLPEPELGRSAPLLFADFFF